MSETVFILGAGASREAGGPLMTDFLDIAGELHRSDPQISKSEEFKLVFEARAHLKQAHSKAYLDIDNIEALFAAFEMLSLLNLGSLVKTDPSRILAAIRHVIIQTLEKRISFPVRRAAKNSPGGINPPRPYGLLVDLMRNRSFRLGTCSVITLNYDVAIDYAVHHAGYGTNYGLSKEVVPNAIDIMKLHGSTNWAQCQKCGKVLAYDFGEFFSKYQYHLDGVSEVRLEVGSSLADLVCCGERLNNQPFIVPPTWNKTQHHREIARVWEMAAKHLGEAENIIVIGYSLPKSDEFFRYLYALGTIGDRLIKKFLVFDPSEEVGGRFREMLGIATMKRFEHYKLQFGESFESIRAALR